MQLIQFLIASLLFALTRCENNKPFDHESCDRKVENDEEKNTKFIFYSIGDWGVHHWCDYNPASRDGRPGCRGEDQLKTAWNMGTAATVDQPEFIISLGDNFYLNGVEDLRDPAFAVTFEGVYNNTSLNDVPWWLVLGDHDHCGNITAQILYSEMSSKWNMPAAYYVRTVRNLRIVFIDSVILEGILANVDERRFGYLYDPRVNGEEPSKLHWEWIGSTLANAYYDKTEAKVVDFIMVIAHRPVKSFVSRKRSEAEGLVSQSLLDSRLEPLLRRYGVDLYLNGHDHAAQHIIEGRVNYVTNGIGGYDAHDVGGTDSSVLFLEGGPHGYMKHELSKVSYAGELKSTFIFNDEKEGYSFSIFRDEV